MPDNPQSRLPVIAAFVVGLGLTALIAVGGLAASVAGLLAQPALALGVRGLGGRFPAGRRVLLRDALGLFVLWTAGVCFAALLLAWPLSALLASGGFGAALAVSAAAGICVIGIWRTWPFWQAMAREGGAAAVHWRTLGERDASGWRGLAAAGCVALVASMVLAPAWPDLLPDGARGWLAVAALLAWPVLHWALQRLPAADPLPMPVVEMQAPPSAYAEPVEGDLDAALYAAARAGRVERALDLVEAGADVHALPAADARDQRSLPVLAAVLPDLRLLRTLIARGADLNAAHAGMTPLVAATRDSWHGRPEAVMTLLTNGADPGTPDREGNTPLHHAARSSDPGVAALLRDAAAAIDPLNHDGVTPLGVACAAGNWRLAKFLLERGAKAEVPGAVPVLLSAAGGDEDDPAGVQLLLRHRARVDARDRDGRSALHVAAASGHAEIVSVLLAAGADVHARDAAGMTPLLDAARGGRLETFEALVAARAEASAVAADGRDAVVLAVQAETPSAALVRRLVELGVEAGTAAGGKRPVDLAAEAGRWTLVSILDPDYPLPVRVRPDGGDAPPEDRPPADLLREGLREGRFTELDGLARLLSPAELGALLVDADAPPALARVQWLLAQGADAESPAAGGDPALFALLAHGPAALPALQALLAHGASPAGRGGLARFLAACIASGDGDAAALEDAALALLARGADPFAPSPAGDPPLALALQLGWERLLQRLVDSGVDLDVRDARGMTALHLAAALGRERALKMLVQGGASPEMRAEDGQTALGVALASGRRDLADWLDWRGWALPKRALQPADVPAAAVVGDADAVRRLLDLGLPVDAVDAQGCTALLRASGGGHAAVVDLLLARGADPQHVASTGATPLSAAVSMRHVAIVDRLLASGAALEQRLPNEVSVLMLAAALGLPDLCARLIGAGADVHATDAQGLTPLHCAALYGFTARDRARLLALFDALLLAGAQVDAVAAGGVTPLLLLLGARAEPGTACDEDVVMAALDQLLGEDAMLDAQDPRGFGPLHLSALHGMLRTTQCLLRAGADPDLRDALNRTPREIAVMRGFIDVAAEFVPVAAGVSMARFLRDRS